MNKQILLGLLLIPFWGYAMEAEKYGRITEVKNGEYVEYTTVLRDSSDTVAAYYMKNDDGKWVYNAYRQNRSGVSMGYEEPQKIFEGLQQQHAQQEAKK